MSYVGVLENVAGFNVFFQVNCKMPMDALRSFLPGVPLRVGRSTRTEPWRLLESQEVSVFSWRGLPVLVAQFTTLIWQLSFDGKQTLCGTLMAVAVQLKKKAQAKYVPCFFFFFFFFVFLSVCLYAQGCFLTSCVNIGERKHQTRKQSGKQTFTSGWLLMQKLGVALI
jgi:hypothetical protein